MKTLQFWDKESSLRCPGGTFEAARLMELYPWAKDATVVLGVSGGVVASIDNLDILRANMSLAEGLTDTQALELLQELENNPPPAPPAPVNPVEAKLDYLIMMNE